MLHDMAVYDVPYAFSKKFRLWYKVKFSILHRQAKVILTVSAFSKERICHHLGIDEARVAVIPNGADHLDRVVSDPRYSVAAGPDERFVLRHRGQSRFPQELAASTRCVAAARSSARYKVCCRGRLPNPRLRFEPAAEQHQSDQVVWAGFVTDGELKALYGDAACLVFPSLYEGFGLPPLEAMYCGCPVIVSNEASLPEVCGDAAMYCDAKSIDDIAAKISLMMGDKELQQRYREMGLRHAQQFRWDRAASKLLRVLYGEAYATAPQLAERPTVG
jgi:glycosyltransferase involved in cell wall biosynthesis